MILKIKIMKMNVNKMNRAKIKIKKKKVNKMNKAKILKYLF